MPAREAEESGPSPTWLRGIAMGLSSIHRASFDLLVRSALVAGLMLAVLHPLLLPATASASPPVTPPGQFSGDVELLDSELREAAGRMRQGHLPPSQVPYSGSRVRVEVLSDLPTASLSAIVEEHGGIIDGRIPDALVVGTVPFDRLEDLEAHPGVDYVQAPAESNVPHQDTATSATSELTDVLQGHGGQLGEQVGKTRADVWHAAGITGKGVKVGIIDTFGGTVWQAAKVANEVPDPAGTFCQHRGQPCDIWAGNSEHGVGVAEIIHEMAPGAQLYLAQAVERADTQAAVDYFAQQGVHIISRSLAAPFDGPGNGDGPQGRVLDDAVSRGMLWLNSAGNTAGRQGDPGGYWRGSWKADPNTSWLEFAPGRDHLRMRCGFMHGLRWSDWGDNRTRYGLYAYASPDAPIDSPLAVSNNNQTAGAPPIERLQGLNCTTHPFVYIKVWLWDAGGGTAGDTLEFMVNTFFSEGHVNEHSAGQPYADSANPGALSVGAIDPPLGEAIAKYSGQGPTNDGRTKPDISAAACVTNFSFLGSTHPDCPAKFNGTSAATPAVAGAAALVRSAGLATTPAEIASYLTTRATVDRGAPGPDNIYGAGELILPRPPSADEPDPEPEPEEAEIEVAIEETGPLFSDVSGTHADAIYKVAAAGIAQGYDDGTFRPSNGVTRAQMASFLARALQLPEAAGDHGFTDVSGTHAAAIAAVAEAGVAFGYSDGTYRPNETVTRAQMASFLYRSLGVPPASSHGFSDVADSVHSDAIASVAEAGIAQGYSDGTYRPNETVTRAQMASFLARALRL